VILLFAAGQDLLGQDLPGKAGAMHLAWAVIDPEGATLARLDSTLPRAP